MERFGGGLRGKSGGAATVTRKLSVAPANVKLKLHTSRGQLPLVTKKHPRWETKSTTKSLAVVEVDVFADKQNNTRSSIFATNSFIRPLNSTKEDAPKKCSEFSFMKFQSKSKDQREPTDTSSVKSTKPLLGKFSANVLSTKTKCTTNKADNKSLFKLPAKKGSLFSFRADTKASFAKKRKAVEPITHKDERTASNNGRAETSSLENVAVNKDKKKQSGVRAEKAGSKDGIRSTVSFASKMGEMGIKKDDGAVLKKRRLLLDSTVAGRALKRSKPVPSPALLSRQDTEVIESGRSSSGGTCQSDQDPNVFSLPHTCIPNTKETPIESAADPVNSVLSNAEAPECEMKKLLCIADDNNEDEFLTRAAAIQEFADCVRLEQKQIRNRLLDAHADVSESLLDALTDLMAEEGGIGIDSLNFNMNNDVNVDGAFLQDDEIRVFE